MTKELKSPLRYPGGKQKDIPFLSQVIDRFSQTLGIKEFREPFLGGGSVLLYAIANLPAESYWGNDAHSLLMDFWWQTQEDVESLCKLVTRLRIAYSGPKHKSSEWTQFRSSYLKMLETLPDDRLHRAAKFFILNRSTSSGTTESGGLTPLAYCDRFTVSSIDRLRALNGHLTKVMFTCQDYQELIRKPGKNVFIFLDPPYLSAEASKLYGKSGDLHTGFNHGLLAAELRNCSHDWLMTIDNSPRILDLYSWANLYPWEKLYSMTNTDGRKSKGGKELLVASFKIATTDLSDTTSTVVFLQSEKADPRKLKPHPLNTEIYGTEDNISDLIDSIRERGFFQNNPILVTKQGRYMQIISGHRRCRAAIEAGLDRVPIVCVGSQLSPVEIESRVLDENLHRIKDGVQLLREFEHRKRIETAKAVQRQVTYTNKKHQNGKFQTNSSVDEVCNIAARPLGYDGTTLEHGIHALSIASKLNAQGYIEDAQKIISLIQAKKFDNAWELAQKQRINKQTNFNSIQDKLLLEMTERHCYLQGIPDADAEKIISSYGHKYNYLIKLVHLLEKHIGQNNFGWDDVD
ncbi:putative DNA methyltransferase [Calothrix brevissima NIES-22]|nr:putative DNA methyltransferase [Calothrix brevissima NIES-22]